MSAAVKNLSLETKQQKKINSKSPFSKFSSRIKSSLSRLGKSLMFPIAILPMAAIFLRMGALIPFDSKDILLSSFSVTLGKVLNYASNAVFGPALPFIFAVGVAFGLSKDNRGESALAGLVSMLLLTIMLSKNSTFGSANLIEQFYGNVYLGQIKEINPTTGELTGAIIEARGFNSLFGSKFNDAMAFNVLNGIIAGSLTALIYNKFSGVELPQVLGFFSGRRLVPVLVIIFMTIFSILWAIIWPWFGYVLYLFSNALSEGSSNRWLYGLYSFIYVLTNRPLIAIGLHHIPNSIFWFQLGSHVKETGASVNGDLNIFFNGVAKGNNAGAFMVGLFPMMLFGLPAMAFAIYKTADKDKRKDLIGMLVGASLISFFTGITEPIEFLFYFASPLLIIFHAVLGATFAFIVGVMNIQLGFGFSAGFIDYLLSIPKSLEIIAAKKADGTYNSVQAAFANPGWMFAIAPFVAASYYFIGKYLIVRLDAPTPGRSTKQSNSQPSSENSAYLNVQGLGSVITTDSTIDTLKVSNDSKLDNHQVIAGKIFNLVGGKVNVDSVQWCATRLRLTIKSFDKVNELEIKKIKGILGCVRVGNTGLQVIVGPKVEFVGNAFNELMNGEI
jgi:PTS system N-acetylglucosamine-specific IIC component